jgi:hypothetical protein
MRGWCRNGGQQFSHATAYIKENQHIQGAGIRAKVNDFTRLVLVKNDKIGRLEIANGLTGDGS